MLFKLISIKFVFKLNDVIMTTREKLESMCTERGMFVEQSKKVLDLAIPEMDNLANDHQITWDRPHDEYPEAIYNILFITVKKIAFNWIENNKPKAWFKPMFE